MVADRRILTARNGKPYAKLLLRDKTGDLPGILWENAQEQLVDIEPGCAAGIRAAVESFNNHLQLRVEKIVRLSDTEVNLTDLLPASSMDINSMMDELLKFVESIQDRYLSMMMKSIFDRDDLREAFKTAPAAKGIHHNYIGGLLEHTLFILKSIDALCPVYMHMNLNRDLLVACGLMHDLGKIYEYSTDRLIDMTPMGRMVGHIYLSSQMADEAIAAIEGFPDELRLHVLHIILAHHGELEFGSPKVPMTKEALFLHMLDDLDAKLVGFSSIIDSTPEEDEFTAFSNVYGRYLYRKVYSEE